MANKDHLEIIKKGAHAWNKWREENPDILPDLFKANLSYVNLYGINLKKANLWEARLKNATMRRADLSGCDLCFADVSGADLAGADLRDANLTEADMSGANLSWTDIRRANLWGANLSRTNMSYSDLSNADLNEVDLGAADMSMVNLRGTNLNDANMQETRLSHADFSGVSLANADMTKAHLEWSKFGDVDLSQVIGLETVRHLGPSTLGIDTIFRSEFNIPKIFLKGCGVPPDFIDFIKAPDTTMTRFSSCFITCAEEDLEFSEKLLSALQNKSVRCWLAPDQMKNEEKFRHDVRMLDILLLILSENTINKEWMETGAFTVLKEEDKQKRIILFPVRIDEAVLESELDWLGKLRENRQIIDFSGWEENELFENAVTALLATIGHQAVETGAQQPSATQEQGGAAGNYTSITEFPDAVFTIIANNNCPLYELNDNFWLQGGSLRPPFQKPVCFILVDDIITAHTKYESIDSDTGYAFKCSGCTGSVRVAYRKETEPIVTQSVSKPGYDTAMVAKLLSNFSLFKLLNPEEIKYLINFLKLKKLPKGYTVINKGEAGRHLYIIVSGKVEVLGEGNLSIAMMGRGEICGEMSLLTGNPAGATIKVVEEARILYMNAVDFRHVLSKFPVLQMYFTQLLAKRLNAIHDVRSKEFLSGMVGKLSEMPPSELFQTFHINQKTGVLTLELSRGPAIVSFREGNLISAEYNLQEGVEAFFEILKEKEGRFKFIPGLSEEEMNAHELGDFMGILMEGIRRLDEAVETSNL